MQMRHIRPSLKKILIGLTAIVQLLSFPVVTFAESPSTVESKPSSGSSPETPSTGPKEPTGADAKTYTWNATSGLWENERYTWNPTTGTTSPKTPPTYTYNPDTKRWDTTEYQYDSPSGTYIPQSVTVIEPPLTAVKKSTIPAGDPEKDAVPSTSETSSSKPDAFSNITASNTVKGSAQSGDAAVSQNSLGANAQSGNALVMANVLNMLQSSWGVAPAEFSTFAIDINTDVSKDLVLDPAQYKNNTLSVGSAGSSGLTINTSDSVAIHNDIALDAASGNAAVISNTEAGDAITGTATAIANIANLINTHIASGQSFVGNININANFEGDILLPQNLQNQLRSGNVPTTTIDTSSIENGDVLTELNSNSAINNHIDLTAESGSATVENNTTAGNASTGGATTNLTVMNLTGRKVVGKNALLVFVNVLGEWVGMIVDSPAGATNALLGDTNTSSSAANKTTDVKSASSSLINNNIAATSTSGDATVQGNTTAGSATSGTAQAGASIANITDSDFSLADWFGILFINVLGSWHGSFGVDTPSGGTLASNPNVTAQRPNVTDIRVFQISSGDDTITTITPSRLNTTYKATLTDEPATKANPPEENDNNEVQVLGNTSEQNTPPPANALKEIANYWPAAIAMLFGLALLATERMLRKHTPRNATPRRQFTVIRP
jgi:hypothetical protein